MTGKITLLEAFNLGKTPELAAFIGGGGKSSLMIALARQLPGRVLVTTTTRMFNTQIESAAASLPAIICRYPDLSALNDEGSVNTKFLVVGPVVGDKVSGVPLNLPAKLLARSDIDTVLVEADGAKMRPVKAPAAHEPALPTKATMVVPIIGIDALGERIGEVAHRAGLAARLLGKKVDDPLTADDLATLLTHPDGGLKNIPSSPNVIATINKVETSDQLAAAHQIARLVLYEPRFERVVISSALSVEPVVEVHKRVTAVILAAGQSLRMGYSKQQLPWGKTTVLGQTIRNLHKSDVHDSLVVTGHRAGQIKAIAAAESVPTVNNPRYAEGEMLSSLQTAVAQLPQSTAAVLVMLADQPMVEPQTINSILQAYWQGWGDIIAPTYNGQQGNPVLIDRRYFKELLALPAGAAPRDLLKRHEVFNVPVQSKSVLQDIDEPEDYKRYKPGST